MKKQLVSLAACTLLLSPLPIHADWTAGEINQFYAEGGIIGARISLSSQQFLRMTLSPEEETTKLYFLASGADDESAFSLQLPCLTEQGQSGASALVSVLPIVNTDNGSRFYLITTGVPEGCLIVSSKGGTYKTAFDVSSVKGDWTEASVEVQKKNLVLHLTDTLDNTHDFILNYNKKEGTFSTKNAPTVITIVSVE